MKNSEFDYFLKQNTKMFNIIERGYMRDVINTPHKSSEACWNSLINLKLRHQKINEYLYKNYENINIEDIIRCVRLECKHINRWNKMNEVIAKMVK